MQVRSSVLDIRLVMFMGREVVFRRKTDICIIQWDLVKILIITKECSFFLIYRPSKGLNAAVIKVLWTDISVAGVAIIEMFF